MLINSPQNQINIVLTFQMFKEITDEYYVEMNRAKWGHIAAVADDKLDVRCRETRGVRIQVEGVLFTTLDVIDKLAIAGCDV